MHSVELVLSQHPWWTLVGGMALPLVGVLVFTVWTVGEALTTDRSRKPNIWDDVRAYLKTQKSTDDPLSISPLETASFSGEHNGTIALWVADLVGAKAHARHRAGQLREILAGLGRPHARLLFFNGKDFCVVRLSRETKVSGRPSLRSFRPPFE